MLPHTCMADCFNIRERITLSHTDNKAGLWRQRKGLDTSILPPAHLLRLQAIHQWFYCYLPRHDVVNGVYRGISEYPYLSQDLTDSALITHMDASHPQEMTWRLWTSPIDLIYAIACALRRKKFLRDSLLVNPTQPMGIG